MKILVYLRYYMKKENENKRNIFGIIKETVFGSLANFFKALGSTEPDEIEEDVVAPELKAQVATVQGTNLDSSDVIEVEAGKTATFNGISAYRREVDVEKAVKEHEEKVRLQNEERGQGQPRTRGAR